MNQQRSNFCITYDRIKQVIYVFGGHTNDKTSNSGFLNHCEKFSLTKNKWTVMSPMENKKSLASSCMFNNEFIYVIGGKAEDESGSFK